MMILARDSTRVDRVASPGTLHKKSIIRQATDNQ
jgi:hypothetical protein